jgi:hypothetical protein
MNIKSHPEYWNTHKKIWQQEYDNLNSDTREIVMTQPSHSVTRNFNVQIFREVERKLLSFAE